MKVNAETLISRYGQTITITETPESIPKSSKAFIQPLRWETQSALYGDYADASGTEQFLYIGLPSVNLSSYDSGTIITASGQNYTVKKTESVYLANTAVYERAVLEKEAPSE